MRRGRPRREAGRRRRARGAAARAALRALERIHAEFGGGIAARKRRVLRVLARDPLATAREVHRLHETLCFLRAYPDDARLLALVERMLGRFDRRADLRRHARALADTGIAGTSIHYRFFAPMARWLAERWPDRLAIDWPELEDPERLEALLPLLAHPAEAPALDELALPLGEWLRRMKSPAETDAAFLARRFAALPMSDEAREIVYDPLDVPMILAAGPDTPSRTRALGPRRRITCPVAALERGRPDLRAEARRAPRSVRALSRRAGEEILDLARAALVTRARDLDAFSYGDPRDVRLVDFGDGLVFAAIGVRPERRLLLEAVYGFLTLKNGVPIGYVLTSALFGSAEIAYNVFETFRGAEAGHVYARVLAMVRHLFRADSFTIVPYQLGEGNDEAIATGAWWFYRKLGFAPRDRATLRLARREESRIRRRPSHRSSVRTLERLAAANLFFELGRPRPDVIGRLELPSVGLHVMRFLANAYGSDRGRAESRCAAEAAELLGIRSLDGWSAGERGAWKRWAPLVLILPGIGRWTPSERRALVAVVRAKGGRREDEFVRRFDAHPRLRAAIRALAARAPRD